ncbi:uncharacterized protein BDZ99DRAFT_573794 [Mytilinidion resinicola]|uniref:Zn(2)-C6 fungal-type domain-containing protein n=1 Tax=Mytilinidion resinicola TaxID=574789 RepID=A0A6A6YBX0_9PEZI|nr:uncharacterized protein BDZ99DRAFT_573794 [Mytilinidion resinicola]KAF2806210.1 hypothetical protein BDZ99DRAFT_573794 [Mytilinidion resinicola]
MGYFGLPSKACSPCRGRRIKCDLSTPACSQCVRSHRTCFGYRNPVDLLFHDQSEDVACKAQRPKRASQRRKAAESAIIPKGSPVTLPSPVFFPISAETQASCFFFSNYPSKSSKTYKTMYEYIPALYCTESSDSPLVCIVTALGLAGLSYHTDTSGLGTAATAWYDRALRKTNYNLRHGELAKMDQTLLVVLLLGLYETNTCRNPSYRSIESALTHVKGATALLDLRGENQLDSEFGRALFTQARTQIITGCYQTKTSVPDVVVRLSLSQRCYYDRIIDPMGDIILSVSNFCNTKAEIPFNPPEYQSESITRATIARYTSITKAFANWDQSLADGFLPSIVTVPKATPDVLSDHYHVYSDIWIAGFTNNYRANSILVHEALISQLCFLQSRYAHDVNEILELEDQISHSRTIIFSDIEAVCASVPGLLQTKSAAAGVGLLWILYLSAQVSPGIVPVPEKTRCWIIGRLEKIGAEMGVRQASTLAALLRKELHLWTVLEVDQASIGWTEESMAIR